MLSLEKLFLLGGTYNQTLCLSPAHCCGSHQTGIFFPKAEVTLECAGPFLGYLYTGGLLAPLWMDSGQGPAVGG